MSCTWRTMGIYCRIFFKLEQCACAIKYITEICGLEWDKTTHPLEDMEEIRIILFYNITPKDEMSIISKLFDRN